MQNQKTFKLTAISGALVAGNGAGLGAVTAWYPNVMPTMPGSTSNDPALMYTLSAVGLTLGSLIVICALLQRGYPSKRKVWAVLTALFSLGSLILGGGFFAGCIIGVWAAVKAFIKNSV